MFHSLGQAPNFSIGSLIGTTASKSLIDDINSSQRSHTYMSDGDLGFQFSDSSNKFIQEIVKPMKQSRIEIDNLKLKLNSSLIDQIRPLSVEDDFYHIPQSMMLPILSHPNLHPLMEQGRISGFGIDINLNDIFLPYHRLAYNGYVEDALNNTKENDGDLVLKFDYTSIDPDITDDQCSYLRDTYETMERMLDSGIDPTLYPNKIS